VFGWTVLGLFTGSQGSECVQVITALHDFAKVPPIAAAGKFTGTSLAFTALDFTCFDGGGRLVPHQQALPIPSGPGEFHVWFWHDKSPNNFTVHKLWHSGHVFICAILRSLSTLHASVCCSQAFWSHWGWTSGTDLPSLPGCIRTLVFGPLA
jgi:hypothetical protein